MCVINKTIKFKWYLLSYVFLCLNGIYCISVCARCPFSFPRVPQSQALIHIDKIYSKPKKATSFLYEQKDKTLEPELSAEGNITIANPTKYFERKILVRQMWTDLNHSSKL